MIYVEGLMFLLIGGMVLFLLIGYVVVYVLVFSVGIYYLFKVFKGGLEKVNVFYEMDEVECLVCLFFVGYVVIDGDL